MGCLIHIQLNFSLDAKQVILVTGAIVFIDTWLSEIPMNHRSCLVAYQVSQKNTVLLWPTKAPPTQARRM